MKRFPLLVLFAGIVIAFSAPGVYGQERPAPMRVAERTGDDRPGILRRLGLSPEQIQQIRVVSAEIRTRRQAAQRRLREANRDLDQAIYADVVDDTLIDIRLKEFQTAQGELAKVNFENELAIRRVLTPDQLVRFREIRRQFAEARKQAQERRQQRLRNRQDQGQRPDRRPDGQPPVRDGRSKPDRP